MALAMIAALAAAGAAAAGSDVPAQCTDPVYLVVTIDNLDRSKSKAYGEGLRSTRIVPRHGGVYRAVGAPALVLEGDWPKERSIVVEEYPCLEAVKTMWYSEEYQKRLKPLRAGSGTYTVAVFRKYAPPASATGR